MPEILRSLPMHVLLRALSAHERGVSTQNLSHIDSRLYGLTHVGMLYAEIDERCPPTVAKPFRSPL